MAASLGRVLVGGKDRGAGFALGPRIVATAHHVVRDRKDKPVMYVSAGGEAIEVERVQPDVGHDAAILWLVSDVGEFLPTSAAVGGSRWRVESPPGGNDPQLHGTVTTARMTIQNAAREPVDVVQLEVGELLGDFAHRTFADKLADRQSQAVPAEDPDYGDLGQAFPAWTSPARDAILQPPKPEIAPSPRILQRVMDRDADWEAAD